MSAGSATTRIVIPLRSFGSSKRRLTGVLDDRDRESLSRAMAQLVVDAAAGRPVAVACDDDDVATWATTTGAEVIRTDGHDLNGSARVALTDSRRAGWSHMVIVHADLPLVRTFDGILGTAQRPLGQDEILIVPDRRLSGTNLLAVPCRVDFDFVYGPGSFHGHQRSARSAGLEVRVVEDPAFSWDVDEPDDLTIPDGALTDGGPLLDLVARGLLTVSGHHDHAPGRDTLEPTPTDGVMTTGGHQ